MKQDVNQPVKGFQGLGIAPQIMARLGSLRFTEPTPIQEQAIPHAINGKDVVGIAQTGTGKTLAFGIPMIQRLVGSKERGLVVLPTRELAQQVEEALYDVGSGLGLRTAVVIGGASMRPQLKALAANPHIIIATPGRLNDYLNQKAVNLGRTRMVVLDEADRMLDMGFLPQIKSILQAVPQERQTMLFSATMPPEIMRMARNSMKLPINIEIAPAGTAAEKVTQEIFVVPGETKGSLLEMLLDKYSGSALIFTRTKYGAKKLTRKLGRIGHSVAEIHSNRSQQQRREAMDGFKSGKYRILIATDIASRGIDVSGIEVVINYDLPTNAEDYIHRIGRTARAGAVGHAISFVTPSQRKELREIEKLVRQTLPVSKLPDDLHAETVPFVAFEQEPMRRPAKVTSSGAARRPSAGAGRGTSRPTRARNAYGKAQQDRSGQAGPRFDQNATGGTQRTSRQERPARPQRSGEGRGPSGSATGARSGRPAGSGRDRRR